MNAKLKKRCGVVPTALALCLGIGWTATADEPDKMDQLQAEMRAWRFDEAIAVADRLVTTGDPRADEAWYLKGVALLNAKKFAEAAATAAALPERFPKSSWAYKAVFLNAQALVEQKKFEEAAELFEKEAGRILSAERKQALVGVITAFADKLAAPPDPAAPDAPKPDFAKAYSLYTKALGMELSRDSRDDILLKKCRAIQGAENFSQAVQDYQAYLSEFDPAWIGPAGSGSARLPMQNPPPAGRHIFEARYGLAESQLRAGQAVQARLEIEDLLKLSAPSQKAPFSPAIGKLQADLRWLMVQSCFAPRNETVAASPNAMAGIGDTGGLPSGDTVLFVLRDPDLDTAIKVCREYLAAAPDGSRAVRAAWMLAEAYAGAGRSDDALAAYRDFMAGKGFTIPAGDLASKADPELRAAPATFYANLKMRALFRSGQLLCAQKKYGEAIDAWTSYIKEYPNGPQWAECQGAVIDTEFRTGMDALAEKQDALAAERFDMFLRAHPLDPRASQILYVFGALHESRAIELEEAKGDKPAIRASYQKAVDEWAKLVSKYPGSAEANAALFRSAVILEEKFGEFEKALKLQQKLAGDSGYALASARIADLTRKSLALSTERTFRTNEKPVVRLKTRNIEKVTVRLYRLDLQAYFRKMHSIGDVDALDVSLIQPDKTWDLPLAEFAKYKPLEQDIEIPFEGNRPGAFVVTVGDDALESTVLVLRSDLEIVVKSSRREVLAFAQDMLTGQPASGAELLVSDGAAVAATGKTDADGVYTATLETLKSLADVRVFALRNGHAAAFNLDLAGLQLSSGLTPKGFLYTDRPAYLPGETVALRGILREVRKDAYAVPAQPEFKVSIADPQGRLLSEQSVTLSRFGTFDASLALPAGAPAGVYTIAAHQELKGGASLRFTGTFEVGPFKLEKMRLAMTFPRRVYFRGETVEATLKADYYWGEAVAGRFLRCTLPDGRIQSVTTDNAGTAKLTFDTSAMRPGSPLTFAAALEGDNVSTAETLTLARLGFGIAAKPSQTVVIAGEPFDVDLVTTGADGQPAGETLKVSVLRREVTKTTRIMTLLPWMNQAGTPDAEVKVEEMDAATDPVTGKRRLSLKLEKGGAYVIRAVGTDRFKQTVTGGCPVTVSDSDDAVKLRFFADTATLKVGENVKVRLHSRLGQGLALLTYEGETILRHQIVDLKKGYTGIDVTVGHDLFPNFRLAAAVIDGRELRTAAKDFTVERELKIVLKPLKDSFLPGEEGKVAIAVTDQTGKPVETELSLALVNEALFASYPDRTPGILDFFQKEARRHAEFKVGATCGFRYDGAPRSVAKDVTAEASRLVRAESERVQLEPDRRIITARGPGLARPSAPGGTVNGRFARVAGGEQGQDAGAAGWLGNDALAAADADGYEPQPELADRRDNRPSASGKPADTPRREVRGEGRWLPSVITGPDGKAVVSIPMPQTTTGWRLTARGCTAETLVGEARAQTLTRKDFFVELKTPSFLREGDELRAVGRIHNLTGYAGPVLLTLRVLDAKDPSKAPATREKTVEVKAKAGAEVTFDAFTAPAALEIVLELKGSAGPNADLLAQSIPVKPWGLPYAAHAGGVAESDTAAVLGLSSNRPYSSVWMTVALGPDVRTSVLDMALRRQGTTPCADMACISSPCWDEHPANDLLTAAAALSYANSGRVEDTYARQLAERSRALVADLVSGQSTDGSWPGQTVGHLTTARVFWALVQARQAGVAVNPDTLNKAASYLQKQFEGCDANDSDSKAVILHALSCDKRADFANCNRLYRDRNTLGNATLACLARAFYNLDRKEIAVELAGILEAKIKPEADQPACWESGCKTAWMNDTDETTAMVLLAFAEAKPESKAAAAAAQHLLKAHGCFGFATSRARGPAVAALSAWFGKGQEQKADLEIDVVVNGREIGTVKAAGSQGLHLLPVPGEAVKADRNVVEFKMRGRGRYTYAATLFGFSPDTQPTADLIVPSMQYVRLLHAQLDYRGRPVGAGSSSPVKNLENGQRLTVQAGHNRGWHQDGRRYALEIALPPGARLTEGSLSASPAWTTGQKITDSSIILYFERWLQAVSFELTGYVPGKYRLLPPVIRELNNPAFLSIGPGSELTVLAAGEKSPDPYEMNDGERYALGKCHFDDGAYATALEHLSAVFKSNPKYNESELARMLLWIYTAPTFYDARKIVELFEILRERYPQLEIPFDRILTVGRAYKDIGEFERSWLVFRVAITASFANDSAISAVLEDEGRFLGSIDFQERLWREYPDTAEVASAYFALSQVLYRKAPKAHELPKEDDSQPEKIAMLKRTAGMLASFLAHDPKDPLADDASFSLANCMLDLKNYPLVVSLSRDFATRFADSPLAPSFQYMTALGLFWQNSYGEALAAAKVVADGDSKDRDFARYILGQIYHAEGKPAKAIECYSNVKTLYPDAAEAIAYFEEKRIALDEVTVVKPGEPVVLPVKYRNIKEAFLQIYRVDLMKLYLQQKNLSKITSVQLAGIRPEFEETIRLGDGKDYVEKERPITLKLTSEAAYLVICRGDDLFTSGLVLITPLKIEVQEDPASGRVRANVLDTVKGGYRPEVHVKAIGSADSELRSGETDLRGLFMADNLRGKATVIAREGDSRYAFFRGEKWLGRPENAPAPAAPQGQPSAKQSIDYQDNLNQSNDTIQMFNASQFDKGRRQGQSKGIQAQKAY
ncbi:MAG: tetratricopeptide repeat protein [bacterium]